MRTMSISISDELYDKLKHIVPAKKVSNFVSLAINKELEAKEKELKMAYLAAENDQDRQNELEEWDSIDDHNQ